MDLSTALIVFYGKYVVLLMGGVVAGWVLWRRDWRTGITAGIGLVLGYALARVAGLFYSHVQPFAQEHVVPLIPHAVDNSFPSDHTLAAFVLAFAVGLRHRALGALLGALAVAVATARVFAGLHWPVDIFASVALAAVATYIGGVCASYLLKQRQ